MFGRKTRAERSLALAASGLRPIRKDGFSWADACPAARQIARTRTAGDAKKRRPCAPREAAHRRARGLRWRIGVRWVWKGFIANLIREKRRRGRSLPVLPVLRGRLQKAFGVSAGELKEFAGGPVVKGAGSRYFRITLR